MKEYKEPKIKCYEIISSTLLGDLSNVQVNSTSASGEDEHSLEADSKGSSFFNEE